MTKPKLETKYYKLERLCKWSKIGEVNRMICNGLSPKKVSQFCIENGFKISTSKMYEYRDILTEALNRDITVERLLGMGQTKRSPVFLKTEGYEETRDRVKNEMDVLDNIIQKGYEAMKLNPTIQLRDAMRAIELKNKITGGKHGGLTPDGLNELRELEERKVEAILKIVCSYLPEDKQEELQLSIEQAEREFYQEHAPHLVPEYEKALESNKNKTKTLTSKRSDLTYTVGDIEELEEIAEIRPEAQDIVTRDIIPKATEEMDHIMEKSARGVQKALSPIQKEVDISAYLGESEEEGY